MGCRKRTIRLGLLALAVAAALLCSGCRAEAAPAPTPAPTASAAPAGGSTAMEGTVTVDGVRYQRRHDLKTILFLGIDNTQLEQAEGDMVGNNGRSDMMMLFLLDPQQKTTKMLTIPRDTYMDLDVYKSNGDFGYTVKMELNMQYSFGNSDTRSCFLTKRKVSELLYGMPITGTLALKMDGIPLIVEELGGITVTLPEDYTYVDPAYQAGAQITLDGPAAEHFVRYRDITVTGTAEQRLGRDTWFVKELFGQLKARGNMAGTIEHLMNTAEDYIVSDVDAEALQMFADYPLLDETYTVPGSVREGDFHDEYVVDEDALQELVLALFYEPAP